MNYKLADGSLSTDYEVGDEFTCNTNPCVDGFDHNDGTVTLISSDCANEFDFLASFSGAKCNYWAAWEWLTPTPETKRKAEARKKPFTKSDLKDGMRVELRDGDTHYVCGDVAFRTTGGAMNRRYSLDQLNDDLEQRTGNPLGDVIKVTDRDGTVLFERNPEKRKVTLELTEEQEAHIKKELGL